MNKKLLNANLLSITQTAATLGVSKRTIQRRVETGRLHAIRPSGKECYFTVEEIEKHRQQDLLSVEEAAKRLGVSITEFLEYGSRGLINRVTNEDGQFGYATESVEQLLHTLFYMEQKTKHKQVVRMQHVVKEQDPDRLIDLLQQESAADDHVEQKIIGTVVSQDRHYIHKLQIFQRLTGLFVIAIALFMAMIVFVITLFFLIVPEETAGFFGYAYKSTAQLSASRNVLGTQINQGEKREEHILGTILKPFSQVALAIVRRIDEKKGNLIVNEKKITDVNDVLTVDDQGNIVPRANFKLPDTPYVMTSDGELLKNVQGELLSLASAVDEYGRRTNSMQETPSITNTSISIFPGQITSSQMATGIVSTEAIVDGAVTTTKLSSDVGLLGDNTVSSGFIKDGDIKAEDIADGAVGASKLADSAVTDSKLSQITASEKVAGSAVQLSANGGFVNNSGLSLLQTCSDGQVLTWNALTAGWECDTIIGGGGDITLGTHTTGNYVGSISNGSGIAVGGSAGEAWVPSIALGALTGDWNQTGAFDIVLGQASSELRILESTGNTFYGTFDVADLVSDQTYTFGLGGTVYTSGNDPFDTAVEIQTVAVGGDVSGTVSNIQITAGAIGTNEVAGLDISDDTNLSASDGITLTEDALTNSDKGSTQNIFKTIAISGQNSLVSDINGDTLTLVAGTNVSLSTNDATDTVTVNATDTNTTYSAGNDLDLTGTTFDLESVIDTVSTINLAGIGTLNGLDVIDATSESTIEGAIDTLANLTSASSLATVGTLTGGSTGAGFTLNFGTSALSGNITGTNIDESTLAGLGTSNFTSANISQWTNDSGYLTSVSNGDLSNDTVDLTKVADSLTFDNNVTFASDNATNDYKLVLDNSSTGDIAELFQVTTTGVGGTVATALNLSDADIVTALALGLNDVTVNGVTLSAAEFGLLDSGVALSELTNSGTLTATTVDINGGAIDGTAIGANVRAAASVTNLNSNGLSTLGDGSGADNITFSPGSGTITFTGFNSCGALETNGSGQLVCGTDDTSGGAGGSSNWTLNNGALRPNNNTADVLIGGDATGSAKFAFMNLNSGSGLDPLASFSGNLRIGAKPNSTALQQTTWTKVSQTTPGTIANGGTANIASISAMTSYNGSVYVGTYGTSAGNAEIYRYDGTNSSWTKVSQTTAGQIASSGTQNIASVSAMTVYDGRLYVGTSKMNQAEIYRYEGGTNWTRVSGIAAGTVCTITLQDGVSALGVYNGKMYAGTREGAPSNPAGIGARFCRYEGGVSWTNLTATAGQFVATTTAGVHAVTSMVTFNNTLFLGLSKSGDADVVRYSGGATFLAMNALDALGTYTVTGGNVTAVDEVISMIVYNNMLLIGIRKNNAASILALTYSPVITAANQNWTRINHIAGTMTNGGTASIDGISSMAVYNGMLYVGTSEGNSAEMYRYTGGDQKFMKVSQTAGTIANGATSSIDGVVKLLQHNGDLYAGTMELGRAEVYKHTSNIDRSYGLEFVANPQIAGGAQNSNLNSASIFYLASASANLSSNNGNTGAFIFSHGIQTRNGSYDVAEDYPSRDDTLEPGDVVSIDPNESGFVKKSEGTYDYLAIGVYSQDPALRLSQLDPTIDGVQAVPVALAGRVSAKVSTENGPIKPGDYLTASSQPGVAMKATKSGVVFGQAMGEFDGAGVGKVVVYIKSTTYQGSVAATVADFEVDTTMTASSSAGMVAEQFINEDGTLLVSGLQVDGSATISGQLTTDKVRVKDSLLVEAMAHIADTLTTARLIVDDIATFFGDVVFKSDVKIDGKLAVGEDTAGLATVKKGTDQIQIKFTEAYEDKPIVTISLNVDENEETLETLLLQSDIKYIITKRSKTGFIIKLNQKAPEDIRFSWTAVEQNKDVIGNPIPTQAVDEQHYVTPTIVISAPPPEPTPTL